MLRWLLIYSIIRAPPTLRCALIIGFSSALFEWRCRATQRVLPLDEFVARKSASAAASYAVAETKATCCSLSCERNISNSQYNSFFSCRVHARLPACVLNAALLLRLLLLTVRRADLLLASGHVVQLLECSMVFALSGRVNYLLSFERKKC